MADVLIDLDRPGPDPVQEDDGPRWTRPSRGQVRVVLTLIMAVATVVGIGAAAPPRPSRFAPAVRIPGTGADEVLLADDMVVVSSGRDQRLYGFGLDGGVRWVAGLPLPRANVTVVAGGVVVVAAPMWPGGTAGIDLHTGALRWTVEGLLYAAVGDTVVLNVGPAELATFHGAVELVGVDARTGDERWRANTRLTAGQRQLDVFSTGFRFAGRGRIGPDGTGEVLDFATGRWRTITGVPAAPPVDVTPGEEIVGYQIGLDTGHGLVVFTMRGDPGQPDLRETVAGEVVAYGPALGAPLWTASAGPRAEAALCGGWICLTDADTTRVLDSGTGADLRRVGWPHVVAGSDRRLLGYDSAGTVATTQVAVFDAMTGRRISSFTGWDLVRYAGYTDWMPMLRRGTGLSWHLATLSMETGIAYPLGTFDAAGERACQSTATHVACTIRSGEIMVWRHAPPS